MKLLDIKPAPTRYLINWAVLCGVKLTPMQTYCYGIKDLKNKLPRGMESKCHGLRKVISGKIKPYGHQPVRGVSGGYGQLYGHSWS